MIIWSDLWCRAGHDSESNLGHFSTTNSIKSDRNTCLDNHNFFDSQLLPKRSPMGGKGTLKEDLWAQMWKLLNYMQCYCIVFMFWEVLEAWGRPGGSLGYSKFAPVTTPGHGTYLGRNCTVTSQLHLMSKSVQGDLSSQDTGVQISPGRS